MSFQDHFSTKAATYALARPKYPVALFDHLSRLAPGRGLAWDCGTGNGQAAVALAAHFQRVIATEPSQEQLEQATPHARVVYSCSAETAPDIRSGTADIVTAAQAAHWFDLGRFYPEARRVLRPGGLLAIWTYALCTVAPEVDPLIQRFYTETVGPYWPPERKHAETGYRELEFPFEEISFPPLFIHIEWDAAEFAVYLRTWSAVTRYTKANGIDPVKAFAEELSRVWGPARRRVSWPMGGRIGRVGF